MLRAPTWLQYQAHRTCRLRKTLHDAGFLGARISAMTSRRLLFIQLSILAILFPYVLFGIAHDYLWGVAWFSAIAHFLGGLWAVFFFAWWLDVLRLPRNLVLVVVATLVLGVCWEIFEYAIGATHFPVDTVDTMADICMDVVGASAGAFIMRYI